MSDITDQQRAKASAHIQLLHSQRQHPEQLLKKLKSAQPENSDMVDQIHEYINFNARRLESLLPDVSQDILPSVNRAILDLVQYADDASYLDGCIPRATFSLRSDRDVLLRFNDKGLTPEEVDRICHLDKLSSEKNTWLKSAFKIASKVHIQSNGYSFSFQFKEGDNGLKRLTPNPEEPCDDHMEGTRIALTLGEDQTIRAEAIRRFKKFPSTFLLFSRNIKSLNIFNHLGDADPSALLNRHNQESASQQTLISHIFHDSDIPNREMTHFHTTRQPNLPAMEGNKKNMNTGIMLAFPFNPDASTLIKQQHTLFNHLPIGSAEVGLNFLIQADFATLADRETVDECSSRNIALLDEIAGLFKTAIGEMCEDKSGPLQFRWMDFLPDNSLRSEFWKGLLPKMKDFLSNSSIYLSSSVTPELLRNLRYVPDIFRDKDGGSGNPLFLDTFRDDNKYLHPGYEKYLDKLRDAGLRDLSTGEMIEIVRMDLKEGRINSKMRTTTRAEWHERAAKFLTSCLSSSSDLESVKSLTCIPIISENGCKWISGNMGPIYYQLFDDVPIPTDLNLRLLDPNAIRSTTRKNLYIQLSATEAPVKMVRELIIERYRSATEVGREASIAHLQYLWWTHTEEATISEKTSAPLHVFNANGSPILPCATDIFLDTGASYGIRKLLPDERKWLLHPAYLEVRSMTKDPWHPFWKDWLRDFIGVQDYPH